MEKVPYELKWAAINDYVSGRLSQRGIVKKYEISDRSVFRQWLKKYNDHREIKDTGKGLNRSMTKGRSTTWKERIDIVYYCLSKDKNYLKQLKNMPCTISRFINGSKNMNPAGSDT